MAARRAAVRAATLGRYMSRAWAERPETSTITRSPCFRFARLGPSPFIVKTCLERVRPWAVAAGGEVGEPVTVTVRQTAPVPALAKRAAASLPTPQRGAPA